MSYRALLTLCGSCLNLLNFSKTLKKLILQLSQQASLFVICWPYNLLLGIQANSLHLEWIRMLFTFCSIIERLYACTIASQTYTAWMTIVKGTH